MLLFGLLDLWQRVRAGQGLPMIGTLLGHTQVQTKAPHAHLAADPVKAAAAEQVSAVIARAALGKAPCLPTGEKGKERW